MTAKLWVLLEAPWTGDRIDPSVSHWGQWAWADYKMLFVKATMRLCQWPVARNGPDSRNKRHGSSVWCNGVHGQNVWVMAPCCPIAGVGRLPGHEWGQYRATRHGTERVQECPSHLWYSFDCPWWMSRRRRSRDRDYTHVHLLFGVSSLIWYIYIWYYLNI